MMDCGLRAVCPRHDPDGLHLVAFCAACADEADARRSLKESE